MQIKTITELKSMRKGNIINDYLELQKMLGPDEIIFDNNTNISSMLSDLLKTHQKVKTNKLLPWEVVEPIVELTNKNEDWIVDFQPFIGTKLINMVEDNHIQFMVWFLNTNDKTSEPKIIRNKMFTWQLQNLGYDV